MAVTKRRMNELWRGTVLAALLCSLLLHAPGCLGDDADDATDAPDVTTQPAGTTNQNVVDEDAAVSDSDVSGTTINPPATDDPKVSDATDATVKGDGGETTVADAFLPQTDGTPIPSDADMSTDGHSPSIIRVSGMDVIKYLSQPGAVDTVVTQGPPTDNNVDMKDVQPKVDVECVSKEKVKERAAVQLEMKRSSSCQDTMLAIFAHGSELCDQAHCKFEVFQEEGSNSATITGQTVEGDVERMNTKISDLKSQLGVEKTSSQPGKQQPSVLVALLVTGLLLAGALIGGYCWKTQRKSNGKSMRLPEDTVDVENQGNTLVSVAPLSPPESQEKPSLNGESPEAKTPTPPAATNGHSATKTPVADTEL